MKGFILRAVPAAILAGVMGVFGCAGGGGEGGGCGGAQDYDTAPQLTCGRGTHQEGNQCVRNASQTTSAPPPGSYATPAASNPAAPTQ